MLKTTSIFLMTICYITDPTKSKAPGPFYKDFSQLDRKLSYKLTSNYTQYEIIRNAVKYHISSFVSLFVCLFVCAGPRSYKYIL